MFVRSIVIGLAVIVALGCHENGVQRVDISTDGRVAADIAKQVRARGVALPASLVVTAEDGKVVYECVSALIFLRFESDSDLVDYIKFYPMKSASTPAACSLAFSELAPLFSADDSSTEKVVEWNREIAADPSETGVSLRARSGASMCVQVHKTSSGQYYISCELSWREARTDRTPESQP